MPLTIAVDFGDYADTAAMLADGWAVVTPSGLATWSLVTPSPTLDSARVPKVLVNGSVPAGTRFELRKPFSGFPASAPVRVRWWQYENQANPHGAANTWLPARDQILFADGTGAVPIGLLWQQNATSSISNKFIQFDRVTLEDLSFGRQFLLGAGTLTIDGVAAGLTRDGWEFDPQIEYDTWEYDGQVEPLAGEDLRRVARPVLRSTFIEVGPGQLATVEPGGTLVDTSAAEIATTLTPAAPGTVITAGALLANVVALWPRAAGGFHKVVFPLGLCTKYTLSGKEKSEVGVPLEIEARASASGAALYTHRIVWQES